MCGTWPNSWSRMDLPEVKENDMGLVKMSWHAERGLLTSSWAESEARESYRPTWMQSTYSDEASAYRSGLNQSPGSPFGKPWFTFSFNAPFRHNRGAQI